MAGLSLHLPVVWDRQNPPVLTTPSIGPNLVFGSDRMRRAEIAPELTGHGLPLSKCEAYNRVYDQFYRSR